MIELEDLVDGNQVKLLSLLVLAGGMTQVVPDEAFEVPEEIPTVALVAHGEVFRYAFREPGRQAPENARHAHVDQFVHKKILVRPRLQAGIRRLGRCEEIVGANQGAAPASIPPSYRTCLPPRPDETCLVLTEDNVDVFLPAGSPQRQRMRPDECRNGFHHSGEPGEILARDPGLDHHPEVPGGHNLGPVGFIIDDLQGYRFALELPRPGFRLAPGGLLGREGGREQQQQQGENSEHSSLSVQREKETRESQQIPLIGGRRVGISPLHGNGTAFRLPSAKRRDG